MLWTVLTPSSNVRLDDISTVQEWHFAIRLNPDLVPRMWRNDIKRCDVDPEFPSFGELSDAGTEGQEIGTSDRSREIRYRFSDIVYAGVLDAKNMSFSRSVTAVRRGGSDEVIERPSSVVC